MRLAATPVVVALAVLVILGMALPSPVKAEDIDLFAGINPSASDPTVLIVWDTAGRTGASADPLCKFVDSLELPSLGNDTVAGMEQCAIVNALLALKEDPKLLGKLKIGLMVFNQKNEFPVTGGFGVNGDGECGYLMFAPRLMDAEGVDALVAQIKAFENNFLANQAQVGDTIAEAWAMLNGKSSSCSGVDYSGLAETATACRDAVVLYIGNAFTNSNPVDGQGSGGAEDLIKAELTSEFSYPVNSDEFKLFTDPIAVPLLNTSGNANNDFWADEWTRFMKRVNVADSKNVTNNVTTYAVSVTDFQNVAQAQEVINYYAMMAKQGGGKSFLVDVDDWAGLKDALLEVFNDVQAVNSVFSAAALPVSANLQGTFLNQVYIALFRPDGQARPRWHGNVKQYRIGFDSGGNLVLTDAKPENNPVDASGARRVVKSVTNPITGAMSPEARSFWTTNTPGVSGWPLNGFWVNAPAGSALAKDSPDGDLVEKGGAHQMLRADNLTDTYVDTSTDNNRKLLTCNDVGACSNSAFSSFDTGNDQLTASDFSVASSSTSVVMTAGNKVLQLLGISCSKGVGGNPGSCTVTGYSGTPVLSAGDSVYLTGSTLTECGAISGPCTVNSVDAASNTFTLDYDGNGGVFVAGGIAKAVSTVTAAMSGHGLLVGEEVNISNCANVGLDFNRDVLPGATDPVLTTQVSATPDPNHFQFQVSSALFADAAALIVCAVSSGLNVADLINWVRGEDNADNEDPAGPCDGVDNCDISIRPSVHGDVLHSRPTVINYGGSIGVVVFYGANDGIFRAINGNQTDSIGGVRAGGELWGFIAPEFFGKLKRLYTNQPRVRIEGVQDPNALPKDYFFDGAPTILQDNRVGVATEGIKYIYLSARRGGRLLYALDVTDHSAPKFLWLKTEDDIAELGQTWAQPKIALLKGYVDGNGKGKPVLILPLGYDPAEDADPGPAATNSNYQNSMGRGVVVLDAVTGEVIWAAVPDCNGIDIASGGACVDSNSSGEVVPGRAVAAEPTLIDSNFDGFIDRVYLADVGANIYRINFETASGAAPSNWSIHKVAALGGTGNDMRKFLFPVDVVATGGPFDVVIAASGDREHPLFPDANGDNLADVTPGLAHNVQNRFYMLQDTGSETPISNSDLYENPQGQCFDADENLVDCSSDAALSEVGFGELRGSRKGYFINLPNKGEKSVNAPTTIAGKTFFATNQPDTPSEGSCTANLGIARGYEIDFRSASITTHLFSSGGMPPSPVAGMVTIGNETIPFVIGGQGPSPFDPGEPTIDLSKRRHRAYWYFEQQ